MDDFDFIEPKTKKRFRLGAAFLNMLTLGIVLSTLAVGTFFVLIYLNPQGPLNPFPPASVAEAIADVPPTDDIETLVQEALADITASAQAAATATPTETPEASATQAPSETPVPGSPTPAATRAPGSYYEIQDGSPAYLDSSVFHPDLECNFLGVAGQAFGLDDAPIAGLFVQVDGELEGENIEKVALTGAATHYGSGSYYEIQLATSPSNAIGLVITLLLESGEMISDPFSFDVTSDCEENLVLINFKALP